MKFYCRSVVSIAAVIAIFILHSGDVAAQAPSPQPTPHPVNAKIVNTETEPVPVTGAVNIRNLGDQPIPVVGTVSVSNLGNTTLLVRDAEQRTPFQHEFNLSIPIGSFARTITIPIPAGKMLVVEHVSGNANVVGARMNTLSISTPSPVAGRLYYHFFPWFHEGSIANASSPVRMYAIGSISMGASMNTSLEGAGVGGYISGYLINVPPSN